MLIILDSPFSLHLAGHLTKSIVAEPRSTSDHQAHKPTRCSCDHFGQCRTLPGLPVRPFASCFLRVACSHVQQSTMVHHQQAMSLHPPPPKEVLQRFLRLLCARATERMHPFCLTLISSFLSALLILAGVGREIECTEKSSHGAR